MKRSFEKLLIMILSTLVDLQGFLLGGGITYREGSRSVLSYYIFAPCHGIYLQNPTSFAHPGWLHYELQWEDGIVPYSIAKHLITSVMDDTEDDDVHVKGY